MKPNLMFLLCVAAFFTACDPDWALHPKNQGWAYIVNESESDITFKGYSLLTERLYTQRTISPGDTVCISSSSWDERASSWDKVEAAGWDPFLATVAKREYLVNLDKFNEMHHKISILTSPDDSLSWVLDVNAIEEDSIKKTEKRKNMRVKDTSIILRGTINLNENVIISDKEMVVL
mgnify:CR=1 FL=1